jgi:threonyl-tRNA synthetase
MIEIQFPDQSVRTFKKGITPFEIAQSISEGLARNVLSAEVNGNILEASTPIMEDGIINLFTWNDKEGKAAFWHSSAHILAQSLLSIYPQAKLTIGPTIENGFYYDVDFGEASFSENDLPALEKQFMTFAREKFEFKMRMSNKSDALKFYQKENNPYKVELVENLEDGTISFCDHANFTDLCRGGHIPHTGFIKAVKLLSVAGAYWRGDETKPQLTRIYGISFPKQKELTEYLTLLEEAKKKRS